MKSDLVAPFGVLATIIFTAVLMALLLYFGTRPLEQATEGLGEEWTAKSGDVKSGIALFSANCVSCHQEGGRGKPGLAPSIRNRDFLAIASDEFIRATIRHGRSGTAMVPRSDLDDQNISDLVAYLRDVPIANPVTIEVDPDRVIPGDPVGGSHLYATYCASCHGPGGEGYSFGGSGPGIGLSGFLDIASDDYIFQTVRNGRVGTPMMPFIGSKGLANLSEAEVGDIIAFLRALPGQKLWARDIKTKLPPDPGKGETLFSANCASCHQPGGVGKPGLAPSVRNRDFLAIASDDFIKQTVSSGRPGTAMIGRPDLIDGPIDHIIAYLRSLPVANPVRLTLNSDRKATGNPDAGREKFGLYCASCHGPNGEGYSAGGSGPGIGLAGFLNVANDDYIFQTIKQGRVGTAMMPFVGSKGLVNLKESDVEDIIVYLRSRNN